MKQLVAAATAAPCMVFSFATWADDARATPEQAEALVKKAIVYYKQKGPEVALAMYFEKYGDVVFAAGAYKPGHS
jgi:hypothetical protein